MFEDDQVWDAINSKLYGAKGSRSGFQKINCPICVRMGETVDKYHRCNLKNDLSGIGVNCFNCNFKARFCVGDQLSKKMQSFLDELGISQSEISRLKHWAWKLFKTKNPEPDLYQKPAFTKPYFKTVRFPEGTKTITELAEDGCDDPKFLEAATYVLDRGHSADPDGLFWSPEHADYVLIPCIFGGKIVGWTGRAINDTVDPKYNNMNVPKNFIFNCDVLAKTDRKFIIIVEGIFDAKAIDGVSPMGAKMNSYQIDWLNNCPVPKIIVPDRDHTGKRAIQVALDNNWYVSLPSAGKKLWHKDIKDADDAVKRYGKLWTVHTILHHMTNNKNEISSIESSFK